METFKLANHVALDIQSLEQGATLQVLQLRDLVVIDVEACQLLEVKHGLAQLCEPVLEEIEHLELATDPQPVLFKTVLLLLSCRRLGILLNRDQFLPLQIHVSQH